MNEFGDEVAGTATATAPNPFGDVAASAQTAVPTVANQATINGLFQGPENFDKVLPADVLSQMDQAHAGQTDKMGARMRAANTAFLAQTFGKSVDEVSANPDLYKRSFAQQRLNINEPLDDAAFYGKVGAHLKQQTDEHTMLSGVSQAVFDGLRTGQNFNQAFDAAQKTASTQPGWDASRADYYRQVASAQWESLKSRQTEFAPLITQLSSYMAKADQPVKTGSEALATRTERRTVIQSLSNLSEDDAGMVMALASGEAQKTREAADQGQGFADKAIRTVERSTMKFLGETISAGKNIIDPLLTPTSSRVAWDAGVNQRINQIGRQLDQHITGEVDPLKTNSWVQNMALGVAEAAPKLASFLSVPGILANGLATKEEIRGQYEDRGLSPNQADVLSSFAAVPATAINFVSSKMVFGSVPGAGGIFKPLVDQGVGALAKRAAQIGALELPLQFTAANVGQALPSAVQSIAGAMGQQVPSVDWSAQLKSQWRSTPETLASLLPLVLIGTATGTFHDRAEGLAHLQNENRLRAVGLPDKTVDQVMAASTPEDAGRAIQQGWKDRAPDAAPAVEAVRTLNEQAIAHREAMGETFSEEQKALFQKYPEFNALSTGQIPIEIRTPEGKIIPAEMAGYQEVPGVIYGESADYVTKPYVGRMVSGADGGGWSHGTIRPGEEIISNVPTADQWLAGQRAGSAPILKPLPTGTVVEDLGKKFLVAEGVGEPVQHWGIKLPDDTKVRGLTAEALAAEGYAPPGPPASDRVSVTRTAPDQYTVSTGEGETLGTARTPETAAQIVMDHQKTPPVKEAPTAPAKEPGTTALNKAEISDIREKFGLDQIPEAQRKSFEETLAEGKAIAPSAELLARDVLDKPRVLSAAEEASMVVRSAELQNQYSELLNQAHRELEFGNVDRSQRLQDSAANVLESLDTLTEASQRAGTEIGRALNIRKMRINQKTYDLAATVQRATLAKRESLTPQETETFRQLSESLKEQETKIASLEAELAKERDKATKEDAATFVSEGRTRRSAASKEANLKRREELKSQLRKMAVRVNDITGAAGQGAEVASLVAQIAKTYIEDGASTLHEVTGKLKEDIPDLTDQDIFNALGGRIKSAEKRIRTEAETRVAELQKQARLFSKIHEALSGNFEKGRAAVDSEQVGHLREIMGQLRLQAMRSVHDSATLAGINERISAVQDQLSGKFRNVPEPTNERTPDQAIEDARATLADLKREMGATDAISHLEEALRTGDLPQTQPKQIGVSKLGALQGALDSLRREVEARKREAAAPAKADARREAKDAELQAKLDDLQNQLRTGKFKEGENAPQVVGVSKADALRNQIRETRLEIEKNKREAAASLRPQDPGTDQGNRTAEQELARLAKSQSDVQAWPEKKVDLVKDAIREQRADPVDTDQFLQKLLFLGVNSETAQSLARVMETEQANRSAIDRAKQQTPEQINADRANTLQDRFDELTAQLEGGFRNVPEKPSATTPDSVSVADLRTSVRELERLMRTEDSIADLKEQLRTGEYKISEPEQRVIKNAQLQDALIKRQQLQREVNNKIEALKPKTLLQKAGEVIALPRSVLATADMSATLRQGAFLSARRPITAAKAFVKSFQAFLSQNTADAIDLAIRRHPNQIERDRAKLFLSSLDEAPNAKEESFTSNLASKIPGFGVVVRASERSMATTLNLIRTASFDQFIIDHPEATLDQKRAFAAYINAASGRGDLGPFSQASKQLATVFFAPRFAVSRFQLLYSPFKNFHDPVVRNEIAKDFLAFGVTGMTVLGLAAAAGAKVGTDPDSPDFGKMVIGNTRIDIWGGLQQPMRLLMTPILAGLEHNGLRKAKKPIDPLDAGLRFLAYKSSPNVTIPKVLLTGKDVIGQKQEIPEALIKSITPLLVQDVYEAFQDTKSPLASAGAGAASFLGLGVSTQTPKPKKK